VHAKFLGVFLEQYTVLVFLLIQFLFKNMITFLVSK